MFLEKKTVFLSLIVLGFLTASYNIFSVHRNITKVHQAGKIILITILIIIFIPDLCTQKDSIVIPANTEMT